MKLRLKKDLIIPKGTEFTLIDFEKTFFEGQSCEAVINMQDTTAGYIYLDPNLEDERFEFIDRPVV